MAKKGFEYAYYEAIQGEMRKDKSVIYLYEYQSPVATYGTLPTINLQQEFGKPRVNYSAIDEDWYVGCSLGATRAGLRPICIIPSMAETVAFHIINEGAKLHYGGGADETTPCVIVQETSPQGVGGGESHADYDCDSFYMHCTNLITVCPATAYDAKGLMVSAIRSDNMVMYIKGGALRMVADEVPNDLYEVPIGKAAVRVEGKDITIVTSGHGVFATNAAVERLKKEGISVESIDLRTLNPLDRKTLVGSVKKTGRLLTVDQSPYTLCPGAEVIATCAEGVPGAKFKRIAFPDTCPGGAPEFIEYMKPNAEQVYLAAKKLLKM